MPDNPAQSGSTRDLKADWSYRRRSVWQAGFPNRKVPYDSLRDLPQRRKQAQRRETVPVGRTRRVEANTIPRESGVDPRDGPTNLPANPPLARKAYPQPGFQRHAKGQPRPRPSILRQEQPAIDPRGAPGCAQKPGSSRPG